MNQAQSKQIPDLIGALLAAGDLEQLHVVTLDSLLEVMGLKPELALLLVRESNTQFMLAASISGHSSLNLHLPAMSENRLVAQHESGREGWNAAQATKINLLEVLPIRERAAALKQQPLLAESARAWPLVAAGRVWAVLIATADSTAPAEESLHLISTLAFEAHARRNAERQVGWLGATNDVLRASHEEPIEPIFKAALEEVVRLTGVDGARLFSFGHLEPEVRPDQIANDDAVQILASVGWGVGLIIADALPQSVRVKLEHGEYVNIPRYDLWPEANTTLRDSGLSSLMAFPVSRGRFNTGALVLYTLGRTYSPDALTAGLLADMASALGVASLERHLMRELSWAAYSDSLTGLHNRRAFERDLEQLTVQPTTDKITDEITDETVPTSPGSSVALVLLDLDDFKGINDTHGHVHADQVLRRLGGALRAGARATDRAYRIGGDEFALLLSLEPGVDATSVAERYRQLLERVRITNEQPLRVSLGCAVYPYDTQQTTDLWRAADASMYRDKATRKLEPAPINPPTREPVPTPGLAERWMHLCQNIGQELKLTETARNELEWTAYLAASLVPPGGQGLTLQARAVNLWQLARPVEPIEPPDASLLSLAALREEWDGQGHPFGLERESIPVAARVVSVARAFVRSLEQLHARSGERDATQQIEFALQEVRAAAGSRFDPDVVAALERIPNPWEEV
jgi:diguanylate cyclase (GGDEF)-like protein